MRAERGVLRGVGLLLAAGLVATGCASLPSRGGPGAALSHASGLSASPGLRDTATASLPEDAASEDSFGVEEEAEPPLYRRGPTQSQGSAWGETTPPRALKATSTFCGEVPSGWPGLDSEEVLAPFLGCTSPAALLALQRKVDVPRLVESLSEWNAVRLGALGPLDADAARGLLRKRADFLSTAVERHGLARAEVLAVFVLHTAYDDEVRQLLSVLAGDRRLKRTLGAMEVVREELQQRGMALADFPERDFRASDLARGLGRAADDAASTIPLVSGGRSVEDSHLPPQLPPPYREAYWEAEKAQYLGAFAPGNVALGSFDALTFGVPVGFYYLVAGTVQGGASLVEGEYEEATRQLAPAALMVGLYAGGQGVRALREASSSKQAGVRRHAVVPRVEALKAVLERLEARLGEGAVGALARYLQQSREGALLVAEWGEAGALALHEARGNVPKAQAWLSEAKGQRAGPTPTGGDGGRRGGGKAGAARGAVGASEEALRARLRQAELEDTGPRLSRDAEYLKQHGPSLHSPPPGTAHGSVMWAEYVRYRARRLGEILGELPVEGPLKWEGYLMMRGRYARGLAFERAMFSLLEKDATLPRAQRKWLKGFDTPRVELHVGVAKADLRFADVLVIEERPPAGQPPRVETFSFKSRGLRLLEPEAMTAQMIADASNALRYYGETLTIRRPGLEQKVQVQRVRLVYESGNLKPADARALKDALVAVRDAVEGVEVLFQ